VTLVETLTIRLIGLEPLANAIAYELSEALSSYGALALPRERDIVIDLAETPLRIDKPSRLSNLLVEVLDRLGLAGAYVMEVDADTITIRATSPERVKRAAAEAREAHISPAICPHCGFTSPYPELMREHLKIHYIL